jgi:hypothetical protein
VNELLQEIRLVREKIAKECDYDIRKIVERMRRRDAEEMARGVRYVSVPRTSVVREIPEE